MHLNVYWCTLKCIPGKWLHFKRKAKPLPSKQILPWCETWHSNFLCRLRSNSIVEVNLMLNHELWLTNKKRPYEGVSVSVLFKKLGKGNVCFSLLVICKHFSTFLIKDHAQIMKNLYKPFHHEAHLFRALVTGFKHRYNTTILEICSTRFSDIIFLHFFIYFY